MEITTQEATAALREANSARNYRVDGNPTRLGMAFVYFVTVWYGEVVDFLEVMFIRINGKVKLYEIEYLIER